MGLTLLIVAFGAIVVLIAAVTLFGTIGGWLARRRAGAGTVISSPDVDFDSDNRRDPPGV